MDAKAMHEVGVISDKEMLEYDQDCRAFPFENRLQKQRPPSKTDSRFCRFRTVNGTRQGITGKQAFSLSVQSFYLLL